MHVLNAFDLTILTWLTGFAGKSPLCDHIVNALSRFDLFKGVTLMCVFWAAWAADPDFLRDQRQKRLVSVLIGTLLAGALSRGLQLVLHLHQRPVLAGLGLKFPKTGFDITTLNTWNSFPSDHAMIFFALGTGLWSVNRTAGLFAFVWTIVVIDVPRVYLGIHTPSDVVAGALFGFLAMKGFLALPLEGFERRLGAWRHTHQGAFMAAMFFATDSASHLLADFRDLAQSSAHILLHK